VDRDVSLALRTAFVRNVDVPADLHAILASARIGSIRGQVLVLAPPRGLVGTVALRQCRRAREDKGQRGRESGRKPGSHRGFLLSETPIISAEAYCWQLPPIGRMLTTRNSGIAVGAVDPVVPAALLASGAVPRGANVPTICTRCPLPCRWSPFRCCRSPCPSCRRRPSCLSHPSFLLRRPYLPLRLSPSATLRPPGRSSRSRA